MSQPEATQLDAEPFSLRALTPARVALARAGTSLATSEVLAFSLAHAQARDAIYTTLQTAALLDGFAQRHLSALVVHSQATDRNSYVRRPDLGRSLDVSSRDALQAVTVEQTTLPRLTLIVADGLSALAPNRHFLPLLDVLLPLLRPHFAFTVSIVAQQARVALGDELGALLRSDLTLMLLGERPGLSSPDSLGAYLTWSPHPGNTDAQRNCVSNIRTQGLDYRTASARIASLCQQAGIRKLTGTSLKECDDDRLLPLPRE